MAEMNILRLVLGGLAAGVTTFLLTGLVNATVLAPSLKDWAASTGSTLRPPAQPLAMSIWGVMSLVIGIAGVWVYAAISPRFGVGYRTALIAGLAVWTVNKFAVCFDLTALGVFPKMLLTGLALGGLLAIEGGVLVGAWLYRD